MYVPIVTREAAQLEEEDCGELVMEDEDGVEEEEGDETMRSVVLAAYRERYFDKRAAKSMMRVPSEAQTPPQQRSNCSPRAVTSLLPLSVASSAGVRFGRRDCACSSCRACVIEAKQLQLVVVWLLGGGGGGAPRGCFWSGAGGIMDGKSSRTSSWKSSWSVLGR